MRPISADLSSTTATSAAAQDVPASTTPATKALVKVTPRPVAMQAGDLYIGPASKKQPAVVATPAPSASPTPVEGATATPAGWVFPSDRPILLFNQDCAVCRKIAGWVIRDDEPANGGHQLIDERPIGYDPEALKKLNPGLDIWDAYASIHMLMPDGTMKTGGEAVAEVFRRLPETSWFSGLFNVSVFGWRPFQGALNTAYHILDKLRPALGCESCGTPPPWWGMPIAWAVKGWKKLHGEAPAPGPAMTPIDPPAQPPST